MDKKKRKPGAGRKPAPPDFNRHGILVSDPVYNHLNRFGNASAEIERSTRKDMEENPVKNETVLTLENPWSGSTAREMTWAEIVAWCADNVHPNDRAEWLIAALQAAWTGDSATLGKMIIGS